MGNEDRDMAIGYGFSAMAISGVELHTEETRRGWSKDFGGIVFCQFDRVFDAPGDHTATNHFAALLTGLLSIRQT